MTTYTIEQIGEKVADELNVELMDIYDEPTGGQQGFVEDDGFLHLTRGTKRVAWDVDASDTQGRTYYTKMIRKIKELVEQLDQTCAECEWVNACQCETIARAKVSRIQQITRRSNLEFMRDEISRMLGECDALQKTAIETPDFEEGEPDAGEFGRAIEAAFRKLEQAREIIALEMD